MNKTILWRDIPVTVRRSARAKKIWLKIRSGKGLEVVLPYRAFASEVPVILERHQNWIAERWAELWARGEAPGQDLLPRRVTLSFLGREFEVGVQKAAQAELHADATTIRLLLPSGEENLGVEFLQSWLVAQGKHVLVPLCWRIATEQGVAIAGVRVRNQASRWGSCSAAGMISLNAKLLFLKPPLVRHVVLHELCHIAHHNHGPTFWTRLRELDPLLDTHETQLRQAWTELPVWSKWRA